MSDLLFFSDFQIIDAIDVIDVIDVSPVSPVSLAHLWVDFRVILLVTLVVSPETTTFKLLMPKLP